MKAAIAVLDHSLDKGVYKDTVQWDTFRKQMSTITNISQAVVGGLANSVGTYVIVLASYETITWTPYQTLGPQ
jgi:hypothetical protein